METQILQSEKNKEEQFSSFIRALSEKYTPLQVYLFGRHKELIHRESCFISTRIEEDCHYFLLMVTESVTRIEHEVQDYTDNAFPEGTVTILAHGKETIAEAISANSRFFITILTQAKLLYSRDGLLQQNVPDLKFIPTQAGVKATKHFNHRIGLASGFLESAKECLNKQRYNLGVFMLHQAVEQSCSALIRVYLAYRSDIHNLYRQLRLCNSFSPAPSKLFFSTPEDIRLFDIMVKSYSATRYKDAYNVEKNEAEQLYIRVALFIDLTILMCNEKIANLDEVATAYKALKSAKEVNND